MCVGSNKERRSSFFYFVSNVERILNEKKCEEVIFTLNSNKCTFLKFEKLLSSHEPSTAQSQPRQHQLTLTLSLENQDLEI